MMHILTREHVELAQRGYPQPVQTDEECGRAFACLMVEMACLRFATRVGIPRDEVGIVVNARTGKAYPQWKHAIPKALTVLGRR
jgi:hypothetical protein